MNTSGRSNAAARWRKHGVMVLLIALILAIQICDPQASCAQVDQGAVRTVPWSGSYWPIRYGQLISGPLQKYDRITGHQAASWELQENPPSPSVPEWFGYCHAWAAAAVLDREPTLVRQANARDGAPLQLGIGDQKGMLTACHSDDVAQHYGIRFQGEPGEDPNDIYPDELWRALKLYIKQRGVPLIVDLESGTQVWNYPVYAYRVDYRRQGAGNQYFGEMSLWMADDAVPADIIGIQVSKQTYYFTFQMQGGAAVLGSARWVAPSNDDHPDFAWYPYIVRSENPEMRHEEVKRLVATSGESPPLPTFPPGTTVSPALPPNMLPGAPAQPGLPPNVIPSSPSTPDGAPTQPGASTQPGADTTSAGYQPYFLSPVELLSVIVNKTSYFPIDVTVDKFDGGHYTSGEIFTVSGSTGARGFLYLFYVDSEGQISMLFPRTDDVNIVTPEQRFSFPLAGARDAFHTTGPAGTHRIKAIVTTQPLVFGNLPMWPAENLPPAVRPQNFLLPPTQKAKFKSVLTRYISGGAVPAGELGNISPRQFLGEFGQDEVAIYVGPAESPDSVPP